MLKKSNNSASSVDAAVAGAGAIPDSGGPNYLNARKGIM